MFSYLKMVHVVCKGVKGIGDLRRKKHVANTKIHQQKKSNPGG